MALNYVPFAERSLEVVVDLYHKTACHKAVINEKVLQNIIKVSPLFTALIIASGLGRIGCMCSSPASMHFLLSIQKGAQNKRL